ncbi:MAG: hypothetical protein JF606_10035 [Burkholderiales bacterium]|nr:hypothetical protein [Burkholderiales bacterium]
MPAFADPWPDTVIVQQPVGQLPWTHNPILRTRMKNSRLKPGLRLN